MEQTKDWHDIFGGPPLTITATDHHASVPIIPVGDQKWSLGACGARTAELLPDSLRGGTAALLETSLQP